MINIYIYTVYIYMINHDYIYIIYIYNDIICIDCFWILKFVDVAAAAGWFTGYE